MRIALVHYHLLRGGVTSVVRHQARALIDGGDEVLVIAGEAPQEKFEFPLAIVENLKYDQARTKGEQTEAKERALMAEDLAQSIWSAMEEHWGHSADVVHVHNPLIRKNRLLLPAIHLLQQRGLRFLLQNHDFAEDYRPDVYVEEDHYPDNCHYGAINSRDYSFLHRSGLETLGLHLLPNEVERLRATEGLNRTRYVYPVRGIRRKNIGEALLLSLFIPPGRTVAITLPPTSPRDQKTYQYWKDIAIEMSLPVEFDLGLSSSLSDVLGTALCVITTSVKEGFGFSFLEPWTAGLSVIGRRIDYVCQDFERSGIGFDSLYSTLDIPMDYLPPPTLKKKMETALLHSFSAFGLTMPSYDLKMLSDDLFSRDVFDFGRLDEELQTDILQTIASNDTARQDILDANPFLANLASWAPDESRIETNRERILREYSRETTLATLKGAYHSVIEYPVTHRLSKSILLELFLDPLKLSLVGMGYE